MESGNVYSEKYIQLARDIAWLLDNGFSMRDNDWVRQTFKAASGKDINAHLCGSVSDGAILGNQFKDYLAGKVLNECSQKRLDSAIDKQLGIILSIEEIFGSIEKFSEQ